MQQHSKDKFTKLGGAYSKAQVTCQSTKASRLENFTFICGQKCTNTAVEVTLCSTTVNYSVINTASTTTISLGTINRAPSIPVAQQYARVPPLQLASLLGIFRFCSILRIALALASKHLSHETHTELMLGLTVAPKLT